jgi:hypothetical protein
MTAARRARIALIAVLLAMLLALCVGYGTLGPGPSDGRFPGVTDVVHGNQSYEGERVVVDGTIVATDPVVLEATYDTVVDGRVIPNKARFTVIDPPKETNVGQQMQVFGVLTDDRTVRAGNAVTTPQQNVLVMYLVSAVAGLWVPARLRRDWRLDPRTLAVHRRTTGHDAARSTATTRPGGDDDA